MSLPDPLKLAEALNPPKSLREFNHRFRTEADCEDFLFLVRYPEGFVCPRCGVRQGWALEDKRLTECSSGHKVSLTSGTAFHRTRQDLLTWFHAVFLISTLTPGISALQFQRLLGLKRYEIRCCTQRSTLVAPGRELFREVEVDETLTVKILAGEAVAAINWWWALEVIPFSSLKTGKVVVVGGFGCNWLQMLQQTLWLDLSRKKLNRVPSSIRMVGMDTGDSIIRAIIISALSRVGTVN